jgi:phosphate uptake regulator
MTDTARIEKDIQAARARLETTVNELAYRVQPQVIAQRQLQGIKLRIDSATHTEDGELRIERIGAVVAAAVVVVVAVGLLRRRRR